MIEPLDGGRELGHVGQYHEICYPCFSLYAPAVYCEEEEEEEEGCDYDVPSHADEIEDWWADFKRRYNFPLYCIVLATEADDNVAMLVNKYRDELSAISGGNCCFIYFRDLERAKFLKSFIFAEHAKGVIQLINLMDIPTDNLPSLLFFESLVSNEYVYVPMKSDTMQDLMSNIREVFSFLYSCNEVTLAAVKKIKLSILANKTRKSLAQGITQFTTETFGDLIRSLIRFP